MVSDIFQLVTDNVPLFQPTYFCNLLTFALSRAARLLYAPLWILSL